MKNLQKGQPMTQSGIEPDTEHIKAKNSRHVGFGIPGGIL